MEKARKILKSVFGYDTFRPLQESIIESVLQKRDTLVIMPTGGGKSLCYQIPALLFEGLTVVISPLISLMKDQAGQLQQNGIGVATLNSSLSSGEYAANYQAVVNNKVKLLYLAPESLMKADIQALLQNVQLDCFTVDEAHCISEWGHDFRPEYRLLGKFRQDHPNTVCIGLTATATPRVQDDIAANLCLINSQKFVAGFNRENLFLQVKVKADPYRQTLDFLKKHKDEPGIIYCFSRKQVDELAEDLHNDGYSCLPYHAGLGDEIRAKNQDAFTRDEVQIIVATIAFGMGINKSNVRFVLHYDLPKNLESYYQEIGRAGRDGARADCLLLYSYGDISKINYFIDQKENPTEQAAAKQQLAAMLRYADWHRCRRIPLITHFGETWLQEDCQFCDNCAVDADKLIDVTIEAQKFLSAVKRTNELYGVNHMVDVLTGSQSMKIIDAGHHNLSVYAIGSDHTKKQWQFLANQFIRKGLLQREQEFGGLKLTEKALPVLFKGEKVFGVLEEKVTAVAETATEQVMVANAALYELLRKKRKELAAILNIPPFYIFSDRTLLLMTEQVPQNMHEFGGISGVGKAKQEQYGRHFLSVIQKYCKDNNVVKVQNFEPKKVKRSKISSEKKPRPAGGSAAMIGSFEKGKTVLQIADDFSIKPQTLIQHLFDHVQKGNRIDTKSLLTMLTAKPDERMQAMRLFKKEGYERLAPIYRLLEEKITYEDLHILRLIFVNKQLDKKK